MDVAYLLFLQGIRESFGGWLTVLVTLITEIPKSPLSALIPGVLFWCVSKRAGLFLMCVASFGRLLNTLIKDTLCVYRPWILDAHIHPVHEALAKASSYSMPSGHTQITAAIYGGLAYLYRRKLPVLIIPCALIIVAVGFSRNFLGVHTPQDVLVAIIETGAVIILVDRIFAAAERDKRRTGLLIFIGGAIFCAVAAAYMLTKSYPVDYLYGKVIVTAANARLDSIDSIGAAAGFLIGMALEYRFINFSVNVSRTTKIRRMIIGCVVGGAAMVVLVIVKHFGGAIVYEFVKGFLPIFAIIFLAPLAFNFVEHGRRHSRNF